MLKVFHNFKGNTILKSSEKNICYGNKCVKNVGEEDDTKIDLEIVWYRILQKLKHRKAEKDEVQHKKIHGKCNRTMDKRICLTESAIRPLSGKANMK